MFFSRWLQIPLYLGLIAAQCVYVWHFVVELAHLVHGVWSGDAGFTGTKVMLVVLGLVDVVMIALIDRILNGTESTRHQHQRLPHPRQADTAGVR